MENLEQKSGLLSTEDLMSLHPELVQKVKERGVNKMKHIEARVREKNGTLPRVVKGEDFKIGPHASGKIMTEPRGKSPMRIWDEACESYEKAKGKKQAKLESYDKKIDAAKKVRENYQSKVDQYKEELPGIAEGTAAHTKKQEQIVANAEKVKAKDAELGQLKSDKTNELQVLDEAIQEAQDYMNECAEAKDDVHLSQTCITYLKKWLKNKQTGRRRVIETKYTYKGLEMEDAAIEMYCRVTGLKGLKNETRFEDDPDIIGTPDVLFPGDGMVSDLKSSWDQDTFPMYAEDVPLNDYRDQLQCYMEIVPFEAEKAELVYALVSAPEELIEREMGRKEYQTGEDLTKDEQDDIFRNMWFDDIPENLRIKRFRFKKDPERIDAIRARVAECRVFIDKMIEDYNGLIKID